ncbi:hypothetical protein INR49_001428 [Caranx melampygus]|nr:hypothetical protein INR49_001428 [Caranx melampygus]
MATLAKSHTTLQTSEHLQERAEKQRMYSVSQGLNSGGTTFLALSKSADLALRRSVLCIWT